MQHKINHRIFSTSLSWPYRGTHALVSLFLSPSLSLSLSLPYKTDLDGINWVFIPRVKLNHRLFSIISRTVVSMSLPLSPSLSPHHFQSRWKTSQTPLAPGFSLLLARRQSRYRQCNPIDTCKEREIKPLIFQ